ncbi:MAG: hypothetical protein NTZ19_06370, partial [Bacteroidetes bacterium]|nr:hypothetical protein [Bacteroidota bacterium]
MPSQNQVRSNSLLLFIGFVLLLSCNNKNLQEEAIPDQVSYNYDVRPILSDKCFNCHGPDARKREAGLRLDLASEAFKALQDHPTKHSLVAGNPQQSELFIRVSSKDTSILMPKPSSRLPRLTERELAIIKKWILQGAVYEPHWAFVAPKK